MNKEGEIKEIVKPICPKCAKEIERIRWTDFAEGRFTLIFHDSCGYLLGVTN